MTNPTEHQHINEQEIDNVITQNIKSIDSLVEGAIIVLCKFCRMSVKNVLEAKMDQLSKQEDFHEDEEAGDKWGDLQVVLANLDSNAENYLKGKQIILEEGLDLNCLEKVIERMYEASDNKKKILREFFKNFEEGEMGLAIATAKKREPALYKVIKRGEAVYVFLSALLRTDIKTVLGDEEFLAQYRDLANAYHADSN